MAFPTNCNGRFVAVDASTGCSLTRAQILGMTPALFEAQGLTEVYMDRVITRAQMARMAGYRENFLEMLLMSRMVGIGKEIRRTSVPNESAILPFIYRRQEWNLNANYWHTVTGAATPGAGSGGVHPGAWNLTVKNNTSRWGTVLTSIERYFLPGKYLRVTHVHPTTKAALTGAYKVISAVNADAAGVAQATITLEPNYSVAGWASLTSDQKLAWQPTAGLVENMLNSVSDFQSWCHNEPSENNQKLLTFWLQTSRFTHQVNDQYVKVLNAALLSGYAKEFRFLPLAKQLVQQRALYAKAMLNSAFFGERISEAQITPDSYRSLPKVYDPANPTCVLEFQANALGGETQLIDCGRATDYNNEGALNMEDVFSTSYDLKRAREATGGTVDRIDWGTNRGTFGGIRDTMIGWYKAKYGVNIERFYQPNQKLIFENQTELIFDVFEVPAEFGGFELGVWHHDYFSDRIAASGTVTAQQNRQRAMWAYDFTDFQMGVAASNSVQRRHPDPSVDRLYSCIITAVEDTYMLESTTWTIVMEDTLRHAVIRNFTADKPLLGATLPAVVPGVPVS